MRDLLLERDRRPVTRVFDLCRNLSGHFGGARSVFARIFKNPEPFETDALDKFQERFELFIGLARETDDERGSNSKTWNSGAQFVDQTFDMLARSFPSHSLQH